jgi:C4-dicarboxylate-specific signal transduction histidine kinase
VIVEGTVPKVNADRDQIVQVLTNLVQNALDAVAEKGHAGEVRVTVAAQGEGHVAVTVSDNGPGVPDDFAPRLFEPYATTKEHGTGLGLAVAQRIAVEHRGELSLDSPGRGHSARGGATFRLLLSIAGPPAEDAPPSR